jgi:CRISPR system Cascade subunit CasC
LAEIAGASDDEEEETSSKERKKKAKAALPSETKKAFASLLDGGKAADLALFGRMLADLPDKNIDAACQVAHAISTHPITMEMDFYTAVDDLQPKAETGAGMMGVVEFNSACFYRYALLDVDQLTENLDGDAELAAKTVEAFVRAAVSAIPTGKQNSFAAQNPPSLVLAVVRDQGMPWSLANAFANPVTVPARPREGDGIVSRSLLRLDEQWSRLTKAYGTEGIVAHPWLATEDVELKTLADSRVDGIDDLVSNVKEALA